MTDIMHDKDTISKGPKRRDEASLQTRHAILIPAGTILRQDPGKAGAYTCPVAFGIFSVNGEDADSDTYKKVATS